MSINYFYQAWNFHDPHFFVLYYEVYIHSQSIFLELRELCGKEVKQEKVTEGEGERLGSRHLSFMGVSG